MLCVVDDAQWLDRESVNALAFVARRLLAERVGLVFATRDAMTELDEIAGLAVEGLQDADAAPLLGSVSHVTVDEQVRDRIVAETRGNPLRSSSGPRHDAR